MRVAPNVVNLPLRPPAVLARSVASLDLLSGGRVELGLGAGAFWDAIAAMGGPRLRPARRSTRWRRRSTSSARVWDTGARRGPPRGRALPGRRRATRARPRRTTSGSGWARTSRGCCALTGAWPTAGCRAWATPAGRPAGDERGHRRGRGRRPAAAGDVRRLLQHQRQFGAARASCRAAARLGRAAGRADREPGHQHLHPGRRRPRRDRAVRRGGRPAVRELVEAGARAEPRQPAAGARRAGVPTGAATVRGWRSPVVARRRTTARRRSSERPGTRRPARPARRPTRTARYTAPQQAAGQHLVDVHDAPARRADPAARPRSSRSPPAPWTPGVPVADQHDDDAAEQLDARHRTARPTAGSSPTHHTLEDPASSRTCAAPTRLAPVIDRLQEEHQVIDEVLEGVDRALVALVTSERRDGLTQLQRRRRPAHRHAALAPVLRGARARRAAGPARLLLSL